MYSRIRRPRGAIPFGYIQAADDPKYLDPIPHELDYLEAAYLYLDKGFSLREVSQWVSVRSGRNISHVSLFKKHRNLKRTRAYRRLSIAEVQELSSMNHAVSVM